MLDPIVFLFHDFVFKLLLNIRLIGASLIAQSVKNLPAMQETWVLFLGREDPLEKEMAAHSSLLACRIPRTEEPGRFPVHGVTGVEHDLVTQPPPLLLCCIH